MWKSEVEETVTLKNMRLRACVVLLKHKAWGSSLWDQRGNEGEDVKAIVRTFVFTLCWETMRDFEKKNGMISLPI
jgi:hypothetical protein